MIDKRDPEQLYLAIKAEQARTGCSILAAADQFSERSPVLPVAGLAPQPPTEGATYGPAPCT